MKTTIENSFEYYWNVLSNHINKRELNNMFPNGYISFCVKLRRKDTSTLQLLTSIGLL